MSNELVNGMQNWLVRMDRGWAISRDELKRGLTDAIAYITTTQARDEVLEEAVPDAMTDPRIEEIKARLADHYSMGTSVGISPTSAIMTDLAYILDRLTAANERLAAARETALSDAEEKLMQLAESMGAVDGYDYRSGQEYGYRNGAFVIKHMRNTGDGNGR